MQGNDLIATYLDNPIHENYQKLCQYLEGRIKEIKHQPKLINQQDENGYTILHFMCVIQNNQYFYSHMHWLLKNGADLTICNQHGYDPVDLFWEANPKPPTKYDSNIVSFFNLILKYQPYAKLILKCMNNLPALINLTDKYLMGHIEIESLNLESLLELQDWATKKIIYLDDATNKNEFCSLFHECPTILYRNHFEDDFADLQRCLKTFKNKLTEQIARLQLYPNLPTLLNKITMSTGELRIAFLKAMACNAPVKDLPGLFSLIEKVANDEEILNMLTKHEYQSFDNFSKEYQADLSVLHKYDIKDISLTKREHYLVSPTITQLSLELYPDHINQAKQSYNQNLLMRTGKTSEQLEHESIYKQYGLEHAESHTKLMAELNNACESIQSHCFFQQRQLPTDKQQVTKCLSHTFLKRRTGLI